MNAKQVQKYVMRFLEATGCQIIEKGTAHVTVKLSVEADKALTNRHYYWSFVERTGAAPETMAFTFVFDPDKEAAGPSAQTQRQAAGGAGPSGGAGSAANRAASASGASATAGGPASAAGNVPTGAAGSPANGQQQDSILGRYFGVVPSTPTGRIPREEVAFGSRRLEQLFAAAQTSGRYVRLFEQPASTRQNAARAEDNPQPAYAGGSSADPATGQPTSLRQPAGARTGTRALQAAYSTWFGVNFKVELACDLKRDEIHTLGIDLATGEIHDHFMPLMVQKKLSPKLPANIFLQPTKISLNRAVTILENTLFSKLKALDHSWADKADERLQEELARIDDYYIDLLQGLEAEPKEEAEAQYRKRQQEIEWQHRPRIQVSVINCGLFHLEAGSLSRADASR